MTIHDRDNNGPMNTRRGVGEVSEGTEEVGAQELGQERIFDENPTELVPSDDQLISSFGDPPINHQNTPATHFIHYNLEEAEILESSRYSHGVGIINTTICTDLFSDLPYRNNAEVIRSLGHKTLLVVQDERVGIDGLYHFVSIVSPGKEADGQTGYVHIDFCHKLPGIKPSLMMDFSCREQQFVVEDVCNITTPKWHQTKDPYFDRQACEYLINFTTEHTSTGGEELQNRMQNAIPAAVVELLDYYDKEYSVESLNYMLFESFQFAKATSWYLNPNRERPRLQVLVRIPAKYFDAIPTRGTDLSNFDRSNPVQLATTLDLSTFQEQVDMVVDMMLKFHENISWQSVKSSYSGPPPIYGEYDFAEEARKVTSFASGLRNFVEINGFLYRDDLGDTIEIGFRGVEQDSWEIAYIIFNNSLGSHVLRVGFERLLKKHPFNDTRTLNYIYNIFEITGQLSKYKELPGGFKEFFESYVLPPLNIDASTGGSTQSGGASGGRDSRCKPSQGNPFKCLDKQLKQFMDSHLKHVGDKFKCESVPPERRFGLFQQSDSLYDAMESGKYKDFKDKFSSLRIPETTREEQRFLTEFDFKTKIEEASVAAYDFHGDPFLEEFIASFQDFNSVSSQTDRVTNANRESTAYNKKIPDVSQAVMEKFAFLQEILEILNEEDPTIVLHQLNIKERSIIMRTSAPRPRRETILNAVKSKYSSIIQLRPGQDGANFGDSTVLTVIPSGAEGSPSRGQLTSRASMDPDHSRGMELLEEQERREAEAQRREFRERTEREDLAAIKSGEVLDEIEANIEKGKKRKVRGKKKTRSKPRPDLLATLTEDPEDRQFRDEAERFAQLQATGLDVPGMIRDGKERQKQQEVVRRQQQAENLWLDRREQIEQEYTITLEELPDSASLENMLFGNPESAAAAGTQAVFKKMMLEISRGFDMATALKKVINCLCDEISLAQDRARRIEDPVARNSALASLEAFSLAVGCENICGAVPLLCSCLGFPEFPPQFNLPDKLTIKFGDIMYGIGVLITNTIITQLMQVIIQFIITMLEKLTDCERKSDSQKLFVQRFRLLEQEVGTPSSDQINDIFDENGLPLGFSSEEDITSINELARETVLILSPREFCDLVNGNANIDTIQLVEALIEESYPKLRAIFSNSQKVKMLYMAIGQLIGPSLCRSLVDLFDIMPFEPSNYICDETNLRQDLLAGLATQDQIQEQINNALKCDTDKVTSIINLLQAMSQGDNVADQIMPPILQTPDNPHGIVPREPESVKYVSNKARTTLFRTVRDAFYSEANQNVPLLVTTEEAVDLGANEAQTLATFNNSLFSNGKTSSPLGALVAIMRDSDKLTNSANNSVMQSVISNWFNGPYPNSSTSTAKNIANNLRLKLENTDETIVSFPNSTEQASFVQNDLISIKLPVSKIPYDSNAPIAGSLNNYMSPFMAPNWDRIPHFEEEPRISYNLCISAGDSLDVGHIRDVYSVELEDLKLPEDDRVIFSFDGHKKLPASVARTIQATNVELGLDTISSQFLSTPQIIFSKVIIDNWAKARDGVLNGTVSDFEDGRGFIRYHSDVLFKEMSEDILKGLARKIANSRFLKGTFQQNYDELNSVKFVLSPECSLDSFGLLGIADVHDKVSRLYDEDPEMDYTQRYVNAMSLGIAMLYIRVILVEVMLNSVFVFSEFKPVDIFKSDTFMNYVLNIVKHELQLADSRFSFSSKDGTFFKQIMTNIASHIKRRKINDGRARRPFLHPITGQQVFVMLPLNGFVDVPGSPGNLLDVGFFDSANRTYDRKQGVRNCRGANWRQTIDNESDCVPLSPEVANQEISDGSTDSSGRLKVGFMEFFILEQLQNLGEQFEIILDSPSVGIHDVILGDYAKEVNLPDYPGAQRFTKQLSSFVDISEDILRDSSASDAAVEVYERLGENGFVDPADESTESLAEVAAGMLQAKISEFKDLPNSEKFNSQFLYLEDGGFVVERYIKIEDYSRQEWLRLRGELNLSDDNYRIIEEKLINRSEHLRGMVNINVWSDWFDQFIVEESANLPFIYELDENNSTIINFKKLFKSWNFGLRLVMVYPFNELTSNIEIPVFKQFEESKDTFIDKLDLANEPLLNKSYKMLETSFIDVDLRVSDADGVENSDPVQTGINLQNILFNDNEGLEASLIEAATENFKYNSLPVVTKEIPIDNTHLNTISTFGDANEVLEDLKNDLNSLFLSNIRARYNQLRIHFNNILFPCLNYDRPGFVRNGVGAEQEQHGLADSVFPWNGFVRPEHTIEVNAPGYNQYYAGFTRNGGEWTDRDDNHPGALWSAFDAIAFTEGYPNVFLSPNSEFNLPPHPYPGYWPEPISTRAGTPGEDYIRDGARRPPLQVGQDGIPEQGEQSSVVQFKEMIAASGLDPEGGDTRLRQAFHRIANIKGWRDSDEEGRDPLQPRGSAGGMLIYISKYLLGFSPIHSYWGKSSNALGPVEAIDADGSDIWGYPSKFLGLDDNTNIGRDEIGPPITNVDWNLDRSPDAESISVFRVPRDRETGQYPLFKEWYIGGVSANNEEARDGKIWQLLQDKWQNTSLGDRFMMSGSFEEAGVQAVEYNYLLFAERMGSFDRGLFDVQRGIKYVYDSLASIESKIEGLQNGISRLSDDAVESLSFENKEEFLEILNRLEDLYDRQMEAPDATGATPVDRCFVGGRNGQRRGTNDCYRYDTLHNNRLKVLYYRNIISGNTISQLDDFGNIFNRTFRHKLLSEIKADDNYQTMFEYIFPSSRFLSLLTIYINEYVSRLPGRRQMFDQTKRTLFNLYFDHADLLKEKWWDKEPHKMPNWWQEGLSIGPPLVYLLAPFVMLEAIISLVPPMKWLTGMVDPGFTGAFLNIDMASWIKFPQDRQGDQCEVVDPSTEPGSGGSNEV